MASKAASNVVSSQNHKERIQELFMLSWLHTAHEILGAKVLPKVPPLDMFSRPIHKSNSDLGQACVYTTQLFEACIEDGKAHRAYMNYRPKIDWYKGTASSNICKLITAALDAKVLLKTPDSNEYAAETHRSRLSAAALKQFTQLKDRHNARPSAFKLAKLQCIKPRITVPATGKISQVRAHKRASSVSPEELRLQIEGEKSVDQRTQYAQACILIAIQDAMKPFKNMGTWKTMDALLSNILELYDLEVPELPPANVFDSVPDIPREIKEHWRDMHAMVADSTMIDMEAIFASVDTAGLEHPASFSEAKDALLRAVWKHETDMRNALGETRRYGKQVTELFSKEWQVSINELNLLFQTCLRKDIAALQAKMPAERYGQNKTMSEHPSTRPDDAELYMFGAAPFTISNRICMAWLRVTELVTRLMPFVEVHLHLLTRTNAGRDVVNIGALRSLLLSKAAEWAVNVGQKAFDLTKSIDYIDRVRGTDSVDEYIYKHTAIIAAALNQVVPQRSTIPQDVCHSFYQ